MRTKLTALLASTLTTAIIGIASTAQAQTAKPEFGSVSFQTLRSCGGTAATPCNGQGQQIIERSLVGGSNIEVNNTFNANPNGPGAGSSAFAQVSAAAAFGLPQIKASVNAMGNVRLGNNIYSFQTYTYRGEDEFDLLLNANFHIVDSSTDGDAGTAPAGTIAGAAFSVWDVDDFFFYADPEYTGTNDGFSTPNSLLSQTYLFGGFGCADFTPENRLPRGPRATTYTGTALSGGEANIGIAQTNCGEETLTLYKGDQFVIASLVQLIANRDGFIDATGTFAVGLDPAGGAANIAAFQNGVVPGLGAVPEPATWAMMIGGMCLAGGTMRHRRTMAAAIA